MVIEREWRDRSRICDARRVAERRISCRFWDNETSGGSVAAPSLGKPLEWPMPLPVVLVRNSPSDNKIFLDKQTFNHALAKDHR